LCRDGAQSVGALTDKAGISQPAVTKHLGLLRRAGLVTFRQDGRRTIYSAQAESIAPLVDWTQQMTGFWKAARSSSNANSPIPRRNFGWRLHSRT
jgi:DNA-binding transcriptional ArsR family regulator